MVIINIHGKSRNYSIKVICFFLLYHTHSSLRLKTSYKSNKQGRPYGLNLPESQWASICDMYEPWNAY